MMRMIFKAEGLVKHTKFPKLSLILRLSALLGLYLKWVNYLNWCSFRFYIHIPWWSSENTWPWTPLILFWVSYAIHHEMFFEVIWAAWYLLEISATNIRRIYFTNAYVYAKHISLGLVKFSFKFSLRHRVCLVILGQTISLSLIYLAELSLWR